MKKITLAAISAAFSFIEMVLNSAVSIKNSVSSLGWSWRVILKVFAWMVLVIALAFGSWKLYERFTRPAPAQLAAPAVVLQQQETVLVTAPVKHYKAPVKKTLNLPEKVQSSEAHVVLTATDLPKSKRERTVSTVLDTETGEVTQYVQEKPLPWVERDSSGSIAMYAGIKGIEPAIRAELKQDLYSVKGVKLGAIASIDRTASGTTDTFVGVGARYEW